MSNSSSFKRKKNVHNYRNGSYVSFNGSSDNSKYYFKCYTMIKSWIHKKEYDITTITDDEKKIANKDFSSAEKLYTRIKENIKNSEQFIIILNNLNSIDDVWTQHEIEYAIDHCGIPIIIVYFDTDFILDPTNYHKYWPSALKKRIISGEASCIHIPFRKEPFKDAVTQFSKNNMPNGKSLGVYSEKAYDYFGIKIQQPSFPHHH